MKQKKTYIILENGGELEIDYLIEKSIEFRKYSWIQKIWKPRKALIDKNSGSSREFLNQKFDPQYLEVVDNGWTHDHCETCYAIITDGDNAYESDGLWICNSCFQKFIVPKDLQHAINQLKQIIK